MGEGLSGLYNVLGRMLREGPELRALTCVNKTLQIIPSLWTVLSFFNLVLQLKTFQRGTTSTAQALTLIIVHE